MIELSDTQRRDIEALYLRMELWRREKDRCELEAQKIAAQLFTIVSDIAKSNNLEASDLEPQFDNFCFRGFRVKPPA